MKMLIYKLSKKSQMRLIKGLIIGILLIGIFSLYFVLAESPANITGSAILTVEENKLSYDFDWGSTSIILYKNDVIFNDIYIENKADGKGWKFGANDASLVNNKKARYKYVLNSTNKLVLLHKKGFNEKENFTYKYPLLYNYHSNPKDGWAEYRHIYNFKDICSKVYSGCEWLWYGNSIEISFVSDKNIDPSIENISSCKTLDKNNTIYQLNKSLSTTEDCIIVTGLNVTFDLKGYNITGDDAGGDYGIRGSSDYLIVENGYVYDFGYGIYLENIQNNKIINITANSNIDGIHLVSSSNNTLTDIITNNNHDEGLGLSLSSNNNITNITSNSNYIGINVVNSDENILTNNNIWNCSSTSISLAYSNYNIFDNNKINKSLGRGIQIQSHGSRHSSHNVFKNTNMTNIDGTSVYLFESAGALNENNTFLNVSYYDEYVDVNSELIRKWYYKPYVNNTAGYYVANASVKLYNSSDDLQTELTGDDSYAVFDGISDYINIPYTQSLNLSKANAFTFSGWVNLDSPTGEGGNYQMILSRSDTSKGTLFYIKTTALQTVISDSSGDTHRNTNTISINTNEWHHVVGIYNGTHLSHYLDGSKLSSTTAITSLWDSNAHFEIGAFYHTYYEINGSIDNVMIFNRALSAEEISELNNLGRRDDTYTYTKSGLVSAWRFDDSSQANAIDSVGDNDGTFEGDAGYETIEEESYEIIDYINNGGTRTYYSNYSIYADKKCYPSYRTYYNVTEEQNNLKHVLTLGSSTYQNWNWNFADECSLSGMTYSIDNYNITSYNSGTWNLDNINITTSNFDMNSGGIWEIIGSPLVKIIGP